MSDNSNKVQLQLSSVNAAFTPKTFALQPTEKVQIDLTGSSSMAGAPSADNGIFPSSAISQYPAHIISHGAHFSFKSSAANSNSIMVNGHLLHDYTHTLRDGDRIDFGKAVLVRYDEIYDDDGDYECCPVYSFTADLTILVRIAFPPHFDKRRIWTDPFASPVRYTPPSSIVTPTKSRTLASSKPYSSPKPSRVSDASVSMRRPPSSSPPGTLTALQPESAQVSDAAAPHGTDWVGVAQLIEELQAAAPLPRSPSPFRSPATTQLPFPPSLMPLASGPSSAQRTFCYGNFVGSSATTAQHGLTGASALKDADVKTSESADSPPMAAVSELTATSSQSRPTLVSTSLPTSVLASNQDDGLRHSPPQRNKNVRDILLSADTALERVGAAWMHSRRAAGNLGARSAELAVARMGAAWRRARDAVDAIALPVMLSTDRLGSVPSSGCVVSNGIERDSALAVGVADPSHICKSRPHSPVPVFGDSRSLGCIATGSSYPWLFASTPTPQLQHHPAANAFMSCASWPWIWPQYLPLCHHIIQDAQLLFSSLHSYLPALAPIHFR